MADPLLRAIAQERHATGTGAYDTSERDQSLFQLDFGFLPSMRVGHALGFTGIGATLLDIGLDPIGWFGPEFAAKVGLSIAKKAMAKGVAVGARSMEEINKLEPAIRGLASAPLDVLTQNTTTSPAFTTFKTQGAKQFTHGERMDALFLKARDAVKGTPLPHDASLTDAGKIHLADKTWNGYVGDLMQNTMSELPLAERKLAHRVIQGVEPIAKLSPDGRKLVEGWQGVQPDIGRYLQEEGITKGFIEDYGPRAFDFKDQASRKAGLAMLNNRVSERLSSFTKHGMQRSIVDYDDFLALEKAGLGKAKEDAAELIPQYFRSVGKAAADKRSLVSLSTFQHTDDSLSMSLPLVAQTLDDVPKDARHLYHFSEDETVRAVAREQDVAGKAELQSRLFKKMYRETRKLTERAAKGPLTDVELQQTREQLSAVLGEALHSGNQKPGAYILESQYKELRRLWGRGLDKGPGALGPEQAGKMLLFVNGLAKRLSLSLTGFHFGALTGAGLQALGTREFFSLGKGLKFAADEISRGSDLVEYAIRRGLSIGAPIDAELEVVHSGLTKAANWLSGKGLLGKAAAAPIKGFEYIQGKVDNALWKHYHSGLKVFTFNELLHRSLQNPKFKHLAADQIAESVAQHVNQVYGGIVWERLWGSKRGIDGLRMLLFAPDWTISNLMTAADIWTRTARLAPGVNVKLGDLLADDVRAYLARQYAFRTRMYMATMSNLANYAFTSWKEGDIGAGHWMDENAEGTKNWIEMPWTTDKGKPQYYKIGKHFTEASESIRIWSEGGGPAAFVRRKLAPGAQFVATMLAGRDMNDQPIVGVNGGPVQEIAAKLGYTAGLFEPPSVRFLRNFIKWTATGGDLGKPVSSQALSALGLPIRGGMTRREREAHGYDKDQLVGVPLVR